MAIDKRAECDRRIEQLEQELACVERDQEQTEGKAETLGTRRELLQLYIDALQMMRDSLPP